MLFYFPPVTGSKFRSRSCALLQQKISMFVHDNWIIGLLIVLILYLVYWHRRPKDFPPGPRGIPILGYFPLFKDPIKKLYELSKKYGPVMSVRMGAEDIIFLNDFGSINQVLPTT